MNIEIWHNIMWSRYKAAIFSQLYLLTGDTHGLTVFQIAETDSNRAELSGIDLDAHRYPYINLFKGSYSSIPKARLYRDLSKRALGSEADLVILAGYERFEYWIQALLLIARGKKFAFFCDSTLYDRPQSKLKSAFKRLFFWMSDGAFCYGILSAAHLERHGMPRERIHLRCQAAALDEGYDEKEVAAQRLRLASDTVAPVFLYVGRLSPEKRLSILLEAFRRVLASYPAARLVVIGKGPIESELKTLAQTLDIAEHVEFAGAKSGQALSDAYLSATCLVLPSYSEPWGLVVNEALSYGCPVLVSHRCGCIPELVIEGLTGLQFDCDNIPDLAEKLIRMPVEYRSTEAAIDACQRQVRPYSPQTAATSILEGALKIIHH